MSTKPDKAVRNNPRKCYIINWDFIDKISRQVEQWPEWKRLATGLLPPIDETLEDLDNEEGS